MTDEFLSNIFLLDIRKMSDIQLLDCQENILNNCKELSVEKKTQYKCDDLKLNAIKEEIDRRYWTGK